MICKYDRPLTNDEQKLVEKHYPLVIWVVNRLVSKSDPHYEDFIQQGCIGLVKAVQKYDPSKNTTFATYATSIISWYLDRYKELYHGNVSFVTGRKIRKLKKVLGESKCAGINLTDDEIVAAVNMPGFDKAFLHGVFTALYPIRLDAYIHNDGYENPYDAVQPQPEYDELEEKDFLDYVFKHIDKESRTLLKEYYFEGKQLAEIAHRINRTRERARQKIQETLAMIRENFLPVS